MTVKNTLSLLLIIVILQACSGGNSEENEKNTIPESCDCDDLILDEGFNHYYHYRSDRTSPYTGKCTKYYDNTGTVQMTKNIKEGKIEGTVEEFYEDGKLKSEYFFNESHVYDELKRYFPSGNLKYHATYKLGQIEKVLYNVLEDTVQ